MKIKDFKCKCGHNDFFFADKGSQKGIYCSYCGKWLKWADKDEQNLAMKQESKSEWEQDHEILKAYSDGANEVLDKIRAEIIEEKECAYADFERYKVEYLGQDWEDVLDSLPQDDFRYGMKRAIDIIDKYKGEKHE